MTGKIIKEGAFCAQSEAPQDLATYFIVVDPRAGAGSEKPDMNWAGAEWRFDKVYRDAVSDWRKLVKGRAENVIASMGDMDMALALWRLTTRWELKFDEFQLDIFKVSFSCLFRS